MKKILLLMILCVTSVYAKEFPEGLNNTRWKQTDLKNNKDYVVLEFSDSFHTWKNYKNDKLEKVITYKMSDCQIVGGLLVVWYEEAVNPDVYVIRVSVTDSKDKALISYVFDTTDKKSWVNTYAPLKD